MNIHKTAGQNLSRDSSSIEKLAYVYVFPK